MRNTSRLLTILFADIGSSVALYDRVGDAKAYELIAESLVRMAQSTICSSYVRKCAS